MATSFSPFKGNATHSPRPTWRQKLVKGAAGQSETGLALSKPLPATLYAPGNIYYSELCCIKTILHF